MTDGLQLRRDATRSAGSSNVAGRRLYQSDKDGGAELSRSLSAVALSVHRGDCSGFRLPGAGHDNIKCCSGFLCCQKSTQVYEVMTIYLFGTERGVIESYYLRQFLSISVKFSSL